MRPDGWPRRRRPIFGPLDAVCFFCWPRSRLLRRCLLLTFCCIGLLLFLLAQWKWGRRRHVFISSAFLVPDDYDQSGNNSNYLIRLLMLADREEFPFDDLPFECVLPRVVAHDAPLVHPIIRPGIGDAPGCRWPLRIVDCPLNAEQTAAIRKRPMRAIRLLGKETGLKHRIKITPPDQTPRSLLVCVSNLLRYEQWPLAIAAIEVYARYGADLIIIPVASVLLELYTLLETYEQAGRIRLKAAVHVPWMRGQRGDPTAESSAFMHVLTYTECLYEYRESADFILNIDLDDFVLPTGGIESGDLVVELQRLTHEFPTAGAFEFASQFATTSIASTPHSFSIGRMLEDARFDSPHKSLPFGRFAIRPSRLRRAFIQRPQQEHDLVPGFVSVRLGPGHRVRALRFGPPGMAEFEWKPTVTEHPPTPLFGSNQSFFRDFDRRFFSFLDENPMAKQEFKKLPASRHRAIAAAHSACVAEIWRQLESRDSCPNLQDCLSASSFDQHGQLGPPAPCILMTSQNKPTRMRDNFHVNTMLLTQFREHPDCLWWNGREAGLLGVKWL